MRVASSRAPRCLSTGASSPASSFPGSPTRRRVMADDRVFLAETETAVPIVHPPGSGRVVGVLGGRSTFKVLSEQTGGAYALLEQEVPPGHGPPLHVHRHETEIFYIL